MSAHIGFFEMIGNCVLVLACEESRRAYVAGQGTLNLWCCNEDEEWFNLDGRTTSSATSQSPLYDLTVHELVAKAREWEDELLGEDGDLPSDSDTTVQIWALGFPPGKAFLGDFGLATDCSSIDLGESAGIPDANEAFELLSNHGIAASEVHIKHRDGEVTIRFRLKSEGEIATVKKAKKAKARS